MIKHIRNLIDAGFSAIWIGTWEPFFVENALAKLAEKEQWKLSVWDMGNGLRGRIGCQDKGNQNPMTPFSSYLGRTPQEKDLQIIVTHNIHFAFENKQVIQAIINAAQQGKATQTFYINLSPLKNLPTELEKVFVIIDHPLPETEEIGNIYKELAGGNASQEVIAAARGLTRKQTEDAFSLSMIENEGTIEPGSVWDLKKGFINDKGYMSFSRGGPGFNSLGGLENLKSFCRRLLGSKNKETKPKGLLLLGMPGVGKSAFAKALGNEFDLPTITLEFSSLFHKYVGESQRQLKEALALIDAAGKVVVFLDELEKSLGGASGDGDSGTSQQMFGTLLSWLNDREEKGSDAFVVATVNDAEALVKHSQGALVRAERFDASFMLDLPNEVERGMIWDMYEERFNLTKDGQTYNKKLFPDEGYTGAEIRACCRLAATMDCSLKEASEYIVPIAYTAKEKIETLRTWAKDRCISASYPGLYTGKDAPRYDQPVTGRKLNIGKKTE